MEGVVTENPPATLDALLTQVHRFSGYDFRDYRHGTVCRRLERRLRAAGVSDYVEYMDYLDAHPEEYQKLADDLTIKTSGFLRSPYSYRQIGRLVLPELLERKKSGGELRFWSAACARGEEPYSLAILLAEYFGQGSYAGISVRGTDIDRCALAVAQAGVYSPKDIEGLSPAILQRYFVRRGDGFEVRESIRPMVSFGHFDLASARSPFVNLDFISCCNVLIYFQKPLQERVLNMLYDSLATPGYLLLGEVETPSGQSSERLQCLDSKARIYRKV